MPVRIDPERTEIDALLAYADDLSGKRVLEVGAGKGRLTWRYADQVAHVIALEPNLERLAVAQQNLPDHLRDIVTLLPDGVEAYQLAEDAPPFDLAIMSWSL